MKNGKDNMLQKYFLEEEIHLRPKFYNRVITLLLLKVEAREICKIKGVTVKGFYAGSWSAITVPDCRVL